MQALSKCLEKRGVRLLLCIKTWGKIIIIMYNNMG